MVDGTGFFSFVGGARLTGLLVLLLLIGGCGDSDPRRPAPRGPIEFAVGSANPGGKIASPAQQRVVVMQFVVRATTVNETIRVEAIEVVNSGTADEGAVVAEALLVLDANEDGEVQSTETVLDTQPVVGDDPTLIFAPALEILEREEATLLVVYNLNGAGLDGTTLKVGLSGEESQDVVGVDSGATLEVKFASTIAGGTVTIRFIGALLVEAGPTINQGALPGTIDVPALRVNVQESTGVEDVNLTELLLTLLGTIDPDDIDLVSLYLDGNGNGFFDGTGTDPLLKTGTFSGSGTLRLTNFSQAIPAGDTDGVDLLIAFNLSPDVREPTTFGAEINSPTDVEGEGVVQGTAAPVDGAFPIQSTAAAGLPVLPIAAGESTSPTDSPIVITADTLGVNMFNFSIREVNNTEDLVITSMTFRDIGTAEPSREVSAVRLTRVGGTVGTSAFVPPNGREVTFSNLSLTIPKNTEVNFALVYDVNELAISDTTFQVTLSPNDVIAEGATTGLEADVFSVGSDPDATLQGATRLVQGIGRLGIEAPEEVTITNGPTTINQDLTRSATAKNVTVLSLVVTELSAEANDPFGFDGNEVVEVSSVVFDAAGSGHDIDDLEEQGVFLHVDGNLNGRFDGPVIDPEMFSGGANYNANNGFITFQDLTTVNPHLIGDGAPLGPQQIWFVIYNFNGEASGGETFSAAVLANGNIGATGEDSNRVIEVEGAPVNSAAVPADPFEVTIVSLDFTELSTLPDSELEGTVTDIGQADLDCDGDLDIVVTRSGAENLIYLNPGDGDFSGVTPVELGNDAPTVPNDSRALLVLDLNRDTLPDIVVANADGDNEVYYNTLTTRGTLSLAAAELLGTPGDEADTSTSVAAADLNLNGFPDLVFGNAGPAGGPFEPTSIFLQDVDANNRSEQTFSFDQLLEVSDSISTENANTQAIVAADLDGDTFVEIIEGNVDSTGNILWRGTDATPAFNDDTLGQTLGLGQLETTDLLLVDIDRNGVLDLIETTGVGDVNLIWKNQTPFGGPAPVEIFKDTETEEFGDDSRNSLAVAAGDLDLDGDLDLLVANGGTDPEEVWLNDGAGGFGTEPRLEVGATDTRAVVIGNFNRVGAPDFAAGIAGASSLVYANAGIGNGGNFTEVATNSPVANARAVSAGDLEADTDIDLYTALDDSGAVEDQLWENDGTNVAASALDLNDAFGIGTAIGDLDHDGILEVAVVHDLPAGSAHTLIFNPTGTPSSLDLTADPANLSVDVAIVDLDQDGFGDVVVLTDGSVEVWLNDRTNNFGVGGGNTEPNLRFGLSTDAGQRNRALAMADANCDGFFDLYVAIEGAPNAFFLNQGVDGGGAALMFNTTPDITFSAADFDITRSDAQETTDIAVGDVNGDGRPDIVTANNSVTALDGANHIYVQVAVGGGTADEFDYVPASTTFDLEPATESDGVALADLDNDGDLDIVFVSRRFDGNVVRFNDGDGQTAIGEFEVDSDSDLQAPDRIEIDFHDTTDVVLVDIDGNGTPDIFMTNRGLQISRLFRND